MDKVPKYKPFWPNFPATLNITKNKEERTFKAPKRSTNRERKCYNCKNANSLE
jgi:hypothetical protein